MKTKFSPIISKILVGALIAPIFLVSSIPAPAQALEGRVVASRIISNDPFFTVDPGAEDRQWYMEKIKVPDAWEYSTGSNSVVVAVVDTGIHASHLELNDGRVVEGYNSITREVIPAGANSDDNGHGTAVAGVIGGIANNGKGISGINWNVKLMPIKALSADGTGDINSVSSGIIWAADHGANVINLSLGGQGFDPNQALGQAITHAYNKGALIIAAAGNDLADVGINMDVNPVYPVCADQQLNMILGVAATDVMDRKTSFSNYGSRCVDVSAPGKRIVTSAYLPSDPSNNVLIYGSGTSLATPIVAGQAALIKAKYPNLSNGEIRDAIIKSSENIDALNTNNCAGTSCNGLIGKGRVNVLNSFLALIPQPVAEGSLIREIASSNVYLISNKTKRLVSNYVFSQRRFDPNSVVNEQSGQLATYTLGPALTPLEGTLVKAQSDPTVYVIHQELKRPLTYLVFVSRGYSFAQVQTLADAEVVSYPTGDWYWPPDGTLVLIKGDPTVYAMHQQVRRPVTYFVFTQRGLSFKKVITVSVDEFSHVPAPGDTYWLPPLDGTLVKSDSDPTIYVIENGTKRALSGTAFAARGYKFGNVKSLPQAEVDVIAPGEPILN